MGLLWQEINVYRSLQNAYKYNLIIICLLTQTIWNIFRILATAVENTNIEDFKYTTWSLVYFLIFICDFKSFKINMEVILQ